MLKDPRYHVMNNEKVNNPLKESKNRPIREKYANNTNTCCKV